MSAVGELLEDPGEAVVTGHVFELIVDILGAADELGAEEAGFHSSETAEAPAGGGHGLEQLHFNGGLGLELAEVGIEERLESRAGFGGEDDGLGGESVAETVAGRAGASLGSDGAAGLCAVGAGGLAARGSGRGFLRRGAPGIFGGFAFRWHVASAARVAHEARARRGERSGSR